MIVVGPGDVGRRLDQVVAENADGLSRARVQQLVSEGHVTIEGKAVRASRKLKAGESILVAVPPAVEPEGGPKAEALELPVLYEDASLLVVAKPAGMAVHPAPGTPSGTVVNAVLHLCPGLPGIGGEIRPGIVHRLDKDTTGVLVVAKGERALAALQAQFKARTVEKLYLALVHGVPRAGEGVLDAPIARHPADRKRYTSRATQERADARPALTRWRLLEAFTAAALLECRLETGRTHQIRVHLSDAGYPLLADAVYGGGRRDRTSPSSAVREAAARLGHQALHARRLAFAHPVTGEPMAFEAPLPPEWEQALTALRTRP